MAVLPLPAGDLAAVLASGDVATTLDGIDVVLVDGDDGTVESGWHPGSLPVVVLGVATGQPDPAPFDVLLPPNDPLADSIIDRVARHPVAAAALVVLLRDSEHRSVEAGLAAESAVYSALQSGGDFAAWRSSRPPPTTPDDAPAVSVERTGTELHVTLDRPHRHNALNRAMRDGLAAAFSTALDDTITAVHLSGAGPSFCSGGDLDEFGTFPDPATAHVTRLLRSPARLAHRLRDRLHVRLHGACLGAGIELPAFASDGHVTATEDASIGLPELELGLIPGAGGTVSLPRRIGRHRTAALALSGARIDAATAFSWGLIDEIAPRSAPPG